MTKTRTISFVAALFVLLAVFTGCRGKAQTGTAKELTAFRFGLGTSGTAHLLGFVAKEEGFFEEEGLDVTLISIGSDPERLVALEAGKLDMAFVNAVHTFTQQAAGHDVTIFGGAMTNGHGYVLKTKYIPDGFKEGDISVFKGRNIAVYTNSVLDYEFQFLLRQNGIEIGEGPDKVNIVYFSSPADLFASFTSEEIDGVCVFPPRKSLLMKEGHTMVYNCNQIHAFENHPCCRQVALTSSLKARPDTYIALERALIKAYKFSQENHAKTIEDVAKYAPLDLDIIEYEIYSGYSLAHPDPDKKPATKLKEDLVAFGYTNGVDYDVNKLYNNDIYKEALTQLLAKNPNDPVYKAMETRFNSTN